jgi:hypothetical protein
MNLPPDIFVTGCPRSGTYLLSMILNHHFSTAIPLETHFIPLFKRFLFLWGDLRKPGNRAALMASVLDFLEIWTRYESTDRHFEKEKQFSLLDVRDQADGIAASAAGYPEMVTGLFQAYAARRACSAGGTKARSATTSPGPRGAKRHEPEGHPHHPDPRDVCLSWRKIWCGPKTVAGAGLAWRTHVREKRRWGARNPARYLELRYEDLVSAPEQSMERSATSSRGGRERQHAVLGSSMASTLSDGKTHPLLGSPLQPGNAGKWRSGMSRRDVDLLEHICGRMLTELGFRTAGTSASGAFALRLRTVLENLREQVSLQHFQLAVKQMLPGVLFLTRKLGISLPRIMPNRCGN